MSITKKEVSLDGTCQHGQMSLGTLASCWTAACWEPSVPGASVSLGILATPKGFLLLLVCGVGDVCGWLFFGLLSAHRNITLASSFAAQLFCGSLAKRPEYVQSESERVL